MQVKGDSTVVKGVDEQSNTHKNARNQTNTNNINWKVNSSNAFDNQNELTPNANATRNTFRSMPPTKEATVNNIRNQEFCVIDLELVAKYNGKK